ncbi:hypothetical protein M3M39_03465 [Fructilactobacillus hinvesii]|uniref:Uncharacterized protein n=1 Tax=Fructilactobacillus hinvesii TaxID=2940300 RepID=A0ABY5BY13_9LACO|nr:hypothetical protein [Fructilactobacillus hinvesii]USS88543.1 hypothetical protein M3M39_03465 [Fructilactobacillus hinvesii]
MKILMQIISAVIFAISYAVVFKDDPFVMCIFKSIIVTGLLMVPIIYLYRFSRKR